jgi:arsenate reductase (glutaredoxin)
MNPPCTEVSCELGPGVAVIQLFGTTKCKVSKSAQRFFSDRGVSVNFIDLRTKNLSPGELASVARAVGGIRALYDAGKDKTVRYAAPSETRLTELLLADATLLVTPIVRRGPEAFVGANEAGWLELIALEREG